MAIGLSSLPKPPHGQPCNGCGLCCSEELCPLGLHLFGPPRARPCPALEPIDGKWSCGLMVNTGRYVKAPAETLEAMGKAAALLLGAGAGCDGLLEGETRDPGMIDRIKEHRMKQWEQVAVAMKLWGYR